MREIRYKLLASIIRTITSNLPAIRKTFNTMMARVNRDLGYGSFGGLSQLQKSSSSKFVDDGRDFLS